MTLLLIGLVVLADFAWENRTLPPPELKLFTFSLGQVPTFLVAYIALVVGWLLGWVSLALRIRKKKRQAAAVLAQKQ
jgi:uncharacterized integral membrane protein